MHDSETRALRRTALLLFAVSAVRFMWPGGGVVPDVTEVTDSLLAASQERLDDAEHRSRPLGPGERIDPNLATVQELDRLPGIGVSRHRRSLPSVSAPVRFATRVTSRACAAS